MRVPMNLKESVLIMALAFGLAGITARATALPASQDQAQMHDYSKNKNFQVGMRDGKDDKQHNKDHSRKRNFKKDEDQKAYESGYQSGRQDNPQDHR
jgi:hypothetical protein